MDPLASQKEDWNMRTSLLHRHFLCTAPAEQWDPQIPMGCGRLCFRHYSTLLFTTGAHQQLPWMCCCLADHDACSLGQQSLPAVALEDLVCSRNLYVQQLRKLQSALEFQASFRSKLAVTGICYLQK